MRWGWRLSVTVSLVLSCIGVIILAWMPSSTLTVPEQLIIIGGFVTAAGLILRMFKYHTRITSWSYWSASALATATIFGYASGAPPVTPPVYRLSIPFLLLGMSALAAAAHVMDGPSWSHLFEDEKFDGGQ